MEGYSMHLSFWIHQLKDGGALLRQCQLFERDHDDSVFRPIIIAQFEGSFGELGIPANAVEQFVNGNHVDGGLPAPDLISIPIFGSRTQVLWHSGHLEGLVSFPVE